MSSQQERQVDSQQRMERALRRSVLWIFVLVVTLGIALILSFDIVRGPQVSVTLGEPARQAVEAPQSLTYVSDVLTEEDKAQAASTIEDQYTPVDLSIGRAQNNRARTVFSFIDVVRADAAADHETKLGYLREIEGLTVEDQVAEDLLALSPSEYIAARDDVLSIIERTMRQGVREEKLGEKKREAATGAAFQLTPAQERVATSLAPQFVVPNVFLDEEATSALRDKAVAEVEPVTQFITKDEAIIRVGQIVTEEDMEMLEQLGLLRQVTDWRRVASAFTASLFAVTVITLYWSYFFGQRPDVVRSLTILGILILLFVLIAKLLMPGRTLAAYLYPGATLAILLAVIFDTRFAIVVTVVVAALVGYIAQDSLEMASYAAAGGLLAALTLRDTQRINALFRAGLVAAVGNLAIILIFRLPQVTEVTEFLTAALIAVINGPIVAASLSLAGIFIIGSVFRVTTPLQLQELSRLDHPLLQELLRRAPGTYHHSIMVANLAEQAAERVKANSTLVRVGAFYHDVGKMNRPPFFSENQNGGNPHDNLDPFSSARIIRCHVSDGLELAKRYHLPNRIRDFIAEHHGDRVLKSFYMKAKEAAGDEEVDVSRFRYPGPRPRSRETGIVQLADSVEATSRAIQPNTEEAIEKLVSSIVEDHLKEGQLDDSGLTLGDVELIKQSFVKTLSGRFHTRVKYPGNEMLATESPRDRPAPAPLPDSTQSIPSQELLREVDEPV